jgi:plasmid maintenance system antidote protein VapI
MYERAQEGLGSNGNEWVNLQRLYDENEQYDVSEVIDGTSERQMRNQFNAWSKFMTLNMNNEVEAAE